MKSLLNELFCKEIARLNIHISELSHAWLDANWRYTTTRPAFTRVYAIFTGKGVLTCNGRTIPMEAGNIYVLPTGMDFSYECITPMEKMYFHINLLGYSHYDLFQYMTDCVVLPVAMAELQQTATWLEQADNYAAIKTKNWLYQVVVESLQVGKVDIGPIQEYSPLIKQTIHYVESHYRSGLAAADIAAALDVAEARLQKLFRREVSVPLGRYINDRLFYYAEQQLRLTDRTIKDISERLGFCDPFYFSRMFAARYGVSPREYRKGLMP